MHYLEWRIVRMKVVINRSETEGEDMVNGFEAHGLTNKPRVVL